MKFMVRVLCCVGPICRRVCKHNTGHYKLKQNIKGAKDKKSMSLARRMDGWMGVADGIYRLEG